LRHLVRAELFLYGFLLLTSTLYFQLGSGMGLDVIKYATCSQTRPFMWQLRKRYKMDNTLINYFLKITNLTADEINVLTESMEIKHFPKGSFLIKESQFNNNTYFIIEGCVRQFKLIDGNEISTNFFTEDQWIISLENFEVKTPSQYYLICVEDTTVVIGNEKKAQQLFKQFPKFETISRQIIETAFFEQQKQMTSYITDKSEQRYLNLMKSRPTIFQRVPQYDIATYIGVKPESLSRIRKKIQMKSGSK
jgi:CRP-like cAMP-binding protein